MATQYSPLPLQCTCYCFLRLSLHYQWIRKSSLLSVNPPLQHCSMIEPFILQARTPLLLKGNNLQASVLNKSLHDQYRTTISEGSIYMFANFVVSSIDNLYRASNHPFKITFTPQTHVVAKAIKFPNYSCKFWTIPDILATTEDSNVDYLIGKPHLSNSFSATHVSFNHAIKEVKKLLQSANERTTPVVVTFTDHLPKYSSQPSGCDSFHNHTKVHISEIVDQSIGESFVIHCEISKLETSGSKKKPHAIESKLKLHYIVKDELGSVSVIFWDKRAVQLIGKSAKEMKFKLLQKEREYDLPDEFDDPVGKKMVLRLKINEYNKKNLSSSISVTHYTICEDLLDQFDEASSQVADVPDIEDKQENVTPITYVDSQSAKDVSIVVHLSNSVPSNANDKDDNNNIMDLTQEVTPAPVKGKRRTNVKRAVDRDDPSNYVQFAARLPTDERLLKVIKQEK